MDQVDSGKSFRPTSPPPRAFRILFSPSSPATGFRDHVDLQRGGQTALSGAS